MFNCIQCSNSFKSIHALSGHMRIHGPSNGKITIKYITCDFCYKQFKSTNIVKHKNRLKNCLNCNQMFCPYDMDLKFCSKSCSATLNNSNRIRKPWSKKSREKLRNTMLELSSYPHYKRAVGYDLSFPKYIQKYAIGQYSRIYFNKCKFKECWSISCSRSRTKYCKKHFELYKNSRNMFTFNFNPFHHPHIIDVGLYKKYGKWMPPNKKAPNPNGVSRDHKISVYSAIMNGYDPYYIKHPINCKLMKHQDNNYKNTSDSIGYGMLIKMANLYDLHKKWDVHLNCWMIPENIKNEIDAVSVGVEPTLH